MSLGPLYSNILVQDNGFYVMNSTDTSVSIGVSFDATGVTVQRQLTFPDASGTIALTSDITGTSTVAADDITPGDSSVKIITATGGLSIFTSNGTSLILGYNDGTNDTTQVSLGLSNMYLGDDNGGGYNIYHASQADNDDLTIRHTGANASSLNIYSEGTGNEALYLGTTAGGITIDATTGISTKVASDDAVILGQGTMGLSGGADGSYTVTHAPAGDLTIEQTGTGDLVIRNTNAGGVIDINTATEQAIKIQNDTYQYRINKSTDGTNTNHVELFEIKSIDISATEASLFVKAQISAINKTSDFASGYECTGTYYWNGTDKNTKKSQQIISHGDTTSAQNGTNLEFNTDEATLILQYTSPVAQGVSLNGLVTVTVAN